MPLGEFVQLERVYEYSRRLDGLCARGYAVQSPKIIDAVVHRAGFRRTCFVQNFYCLCRIPRNDCDCDCDYDQAIF